MAPTLGTGKTKVRLYADYFCAPCRALEPKIEPVLTDLLKKNLITITFIDAPFHKYSSLYTRYFLFIYRERREPGHILRARNLLFEASKEGKEGITDQGKLEEFLQKNFIRFKPFDVMPVFSVLESLLKEDKITETPTCVIINGNKKETYKGAADILKGLSAIR